MVVLIVGLILTVGGILLILPWAWWGRFVIVLLGSIPPLLIICGLAAIAVGISSVRDKLAAAKEETPQPSTTPTEEKKEEEKKEETGGTT